MPGLLGFMKSFSFIRLTESGRVSNFPGFIVSAHMVGGSGGAATASLRDGHHASSEVKIDFSAGASGVDARTFVPPVWFDRGVYLTLGSNVTSIFVLMEVVRNGRVPIKQGSWFDRFSSWLHRSPGGVGYE